MAKHQPVDVRQQQLFEAALAVVVERGYYDTRIDDIVGRVGLSKGSFYHHFQNKDDFFLKLLAHLMAQFKAQMSELLQESPTASEALSRILQCFDLWIAQNPQLMRGLIDFYLLAARQQGYRQVFLSYYDELVGVLAEIIQQGIAGGEFAAGLDSERVAWALATSCDGLILLHTVLGKHELGIQTMRDATDLILRGARTPQEAAAPPRRRTRRKETR